MGVEALLFLLAAIISAVLLFIMVYFVIMFTDLENDYINPIDLCTKLNHFVIPNYIAHAIMTLFFLFTGKWLTFLFNLPLLCYNIKRYIDNRHLFDATEIIRTLSYDKKESIIKLVFFFISFFLYLCGMAMAILKNY
ncbi:cornichon [Neocallimastix lanati (nom. inval.)]|uniref:Cornichon n=1 Tax=Neocallimastix californiae TaxID=1754190 RepID=A0A1Y1ZN48_9FUNG|nr:cornichon [Neocallimastix sp. JGI-2020a]ORY11672.1 cornichon [Neocallimastix californiae]|eukprot:ORY11672.1 cornichon [Neocallimastix californiae]